MFIPIQRTLLNGRLPRLLTNHSSNWKRLARSYSSFHCPTAPIHLTYPSSRPSADKNVWSGKGLGDNFLRWQSSDSINWLWEVKDEGEKGIIEANKQGTRGLYLVLTLNSKTPLEPEHFFQASEDIKRKFPNLRCVFRNRGDETWVCQLPNSKLDFKVLTDEEKFDEDCGHIAREGFTESDSLSFKTRVIKRGPSVPGNIDIRDRYPYQYDFFLTANHALTDGIDVIRMLQIVYQSLELQMAGKCLSQDEVGVFEKNKELELISTQRRDELLRNPSRIEHIKGSLPKLTDVPSIIEAFPRPVVTKVTTKYLQRNVDMQVTKALLSKCSEKGVTFNSLCIAIENVALIELMKEAGLEKDFYRIACLMFVDLRRYLKKGRYILGSYAPPLTYMSDVDANIHKSFWDYCKRVNYELRMNYAKDASFLDQSIVQKMIDSGHGPFNYTDNPRPVCHDYSNVNVGDLNQIFQSAGEYVQITNLNSFQLLHNSRNALTQTIHTINGRIHCSFSYANNYFTDEIANLIADKVINIMKSVAK